MDSNDFVSPNHILAETLVNVNDQDLRNGFTKGWYISRMQDALQELAFDTFYQEITQDFDFPTNSLAIAMPKNAFNVRKIYVYNAECCSPQNSSVVYWKRNYDNDAGKNTHGYTARAKAHRDPDNPFMPSFRGADRYHYANIQNGIIMFSSSCSKFQKIRIVYNGMGVEIGDEPIIPRFFERYINQYIEERYYSAMKARDPRKWRILWADASAMKDKEGEKARMRIAAMNSFEKQSLEEYISNIVAK